MYVSDTIVSHERFSPCSAPIYHSVLCRRSTGGLAVSEDTLKEYQGRADPIAHQTGVPICPRCILRAEPPDWQNRPSFEDWSVDIRACSLRSNLTFVLCLYRLDPTRSEMRLYLVALLPALGHLTSCLAQKAEARVTVGPPAPPFGSTPVAQNTTCVRQTHIKWTIEYTFVASTAYDTTTIK
jgi:hypothetical protein